MLRIALLVFTALAAMPVAWASRATYAETTGSVAIACEFLADAIDGTLADVTDSADLADACDSLDATDVAAIASALGDEDGWLEAPDFAAIDLDGNQIMDAGLDYHDEIYVIAFVDDDGTVTFDAGAGLNVNVNADTGGFSTDQDANAETCTGNDDLDCNDSTLGDGDGVVVVTLTDGTAYLGGVSVDVFQADNSSQVFTQDIFVHGYPDEIWISVLESFVSPTADVSACTEAADFASADTQINDPDRTVITVEVVDSYGYALTRIPVHISATAPNVPRGSLHRPSNSRMVAQYRCWRADADLNAT